MFDSHAHLQDPRITDAAAVWERARAQGVRRVLLAGVDADDWERQAMLADLPGVSQSVGIHPQVVATLTDIDCEDQLALLERALGTRVAVALGEIGMDGVGDRRASYAQQSALFAEQLRLAKQFDLPVILHVLRAHEEALKVIGDVGIGPAGGVMHSYSGSAELVPRYLEHGLHLSFSGSVTWHDTGRAVRAVKSCPLEKLLVETDAPDQTPREHRPAPNEPAFLGEVVTTIASIREQPASDIARVTYQNACRLFRLPEDP